ncbi:hypothetical protein LCGC14_0336370 [marine sediment metagenome]|uniref:Uncharacterized protein n=1 Tax=marine sediment metagenome TaxID=412755 RepID=A0A0F9TXX4_9ZZZZ
MSKRTKRIGRYEPVRFMQQASARTADSFRERTEVETEYIRRDALVMELRGTEKVVAGQLEADATHLVYMHSDTAARALTPRNWILRTSQGNARLNILWIRAVGNDGMELELQCNERDEP